MYTKRTAKNGRVLYFLNGKLVSQNSIPEDAAVQDLDYEVKDLELPVVEIETETVDPDISTNDTFNQEPSAGCVACGARSEFQRFVNLRNVDLCKEHYDTLTLGEIVQVLREKG